MARAGLPTLQEALAQLARPVMAGGETEAGPAVRFCDNGGAVSRCDLATGAIAETGAAGFPVWDAADGFGAYADGALTLGGATLACDTPVDEPVAAALAEAQF